jgi:hypoxanthine phosphoribosyltransferase
MIQLHDKQFVPFISQRNRVCHHKKMQQVEDDFIDETPVFIGVLNGSLWWFLTL